MEQLVFSKTYLIVIHLHMTKCPSFMIYKVHELCESIYFTQGQIVTMDGHYHEYFKI